MDIQIKNINKRLYNLTVLNDVNLHIRSGELVALLGPSGAGKTMLLRLIAGLEFADTGVVLFDGKAMQTKHAKDRNVGFVFQHHALFMHMTVFENVAFGLKVRARQARSDDKEIRYKVINLLDLVHLEAFRDRYPHELSASQRQRVALVRALAVNPSVLLLDEPFGALDTKVRKELRRWIRKIHDEIRITTIFATHDHKEAMEVSDRVVIMNAGKIIQVGTPTEVWHYPINHFVYEYLGNFNKFHGWKDEEGKVYFNDESKPMHTQAVLLYVRPQDVHVTKKPNELEYILTKVVNINLTGSMIKLELEYNGGELLQAEISQNLFEGLNIKRGDKLYAKPTITKEFE